jgi:hypothetical protein
VAGSFLPDRPVLRTAVYWGLAWAALGLSCKGSKSTGDVMSGGEFWELLTVGGAIVGAAFGALYAWTRRKYSPLGARRMAGDPMGLKARLIAGAHGFVVVGVPCGLSALNPAILGIMGTLGFVTAALLPGDADIRT